MALEKSFHFLDPALCIVHFAIIVLLINNGLGMRAKRYKDSS
jgi:hypothetical protein